LALIRYEQCEAMGIPLVQGGLLDQPHIWLMEYGIVKHALLIWEAMQSRPSEGPPPGQV